MRNAYKIVGGNPLRPMCSWENTIRMILGKRVGSCGLDTMDSG